METPQSPEEKPRHISKSPLEKLKTLAQRISNAVMGLIKKKEVGVLPPGEHEDGVNPLMKLWDSLVARFKGLIAKCPAPVRAVAEPNAGKILAGILIVLAAFAFKTVFLSKKSGPKISLEQAMKEKQQTNTDTLVPIKGFKVGRFNFEDSLNALGTIKGAMEFKLSFEVPGTISSINYREGERYEEGALLISLKQDDILLRLKRAQAEFNKANAQAQIAEQKVKENEKLFSMGAVPKTTLDQAKLEYDSAKYEAEANRLEVKANEAMLEKSNLYAPSAGMIGDLNVEEGETVTQNTLLGTHIMTEYVYAEFGVVERDVNKIALGQKARVFVDAYPDKTFEGVIENIAPVVAGTSRTATVKVRVENPDRLLLPGMFARIRILLYSKKNTLVVPTDAVQGKEGEQFVYVVHSSKGPLIQAPKDKGGKDKTQNQQPETKGVPGAQAAGGTEAKPQEKVLKPEPAKTGETKEGKKKEEKAKAKKKGKENKKAEAVPEAEQKPKEELTVKKRPITVGYTRPDYTQIDAGLSEGEVIAISGLEKLEDGKKIRLLETQEAEI